jgi:hypothetical protein
MALASVRVAPSRSTAAPPAAAVSAAATNRLTAARRAPSRHISTPQRRPGAIERPTLSASRRPGRRDRDGFRG